MKQTQFFVSVQGQQIGPLTLSEIFHKIEGREIGITDYLFDEAKNDWVAVLEYTPIAEHLKQQKPKAPPAPAPAPASTPEPVNTVAQKPTLKIVPKGNEPEYLSYEWFVLKGDNKFGPFAYVDLVKMLQDKTVFEFDYVWHSKLSTWTRLAELKEFNSSEIERLRDTEMPEISEVFFRRRHKRISFNASILVHDNKAVWKGEGIEISAGGAGLYMENALLVPGQTLYLHFKPGDGVPPFNATCEIVSKKYVKGVKDRQSPIKYGVKFISIAPTALSVIEAYTSREAA